VTVEQASTQQVIVLYSIGPCFCVNQQQGLSKPVQWDSPWSSMGLPLGFYGTLLVVLWDSPCSSMGLPLAVLWDSPCSSMGLPLAVLWDSPLQFYGTPPCSSMGLPLAVLWDSPWGLILWLLFHVKGAIFQLYHVEKKLHCDERMSACIRATHLDRIL
jgi:hypothetical protein